MCVRFTCYGVIKVVENKYLLFKIKISSIKRPWKSLLN